MAIDINIPSQVKNYANLAGFPVTGTLKTIYIAEDTNKTYRWTGSAYVEISASQAASWGSITGTLSSQTDLQTALNAKQDSLGFTPVPTSRTLTINGTTQDLSADRTFTISTGITIGTTAITSGTVGRVLFEGTGNVVSESANLFWDNTNGRLGIGGTPGAYRLDVNGNIAVNNSIYVYSTAYASYTRALYDDGSLSTVVRGNTHLDFWSANNFRMRINNSGNVLINTTTDAGFKLDVNGTAILRDTLYISNQGRVSWGGGFFNIFADGSNGLSLLTPFGRVLSCTQTTGNVLINTTTDIASSKLTIESTTQGFLPPRMTTTQKNAIASPATGLMVYDTTLNLMALYNGTVWTTL